MGATRRGQLSKLMHPVRLGRWHAMAGCDILDTTEEMP